MVWALDSLMDAIEPNRFNLPHQVPGKYIPNSSFSIFHGSLGPNMGKSFEILHLMSFYSGVITSAQ